jgi:AcrR family transcriptional regulator
MRRLADQADVSVRTLYNLFGDKDGLLTALVQHSLDSIHVAHSDIRATDPIEQIWEVVTITVDTTVRSLPKAVLAAVLSDEELYGRLERRWRGRELTINAIRAATRAGALRDDVPAEVVVDHAGMVHRHLLRRWAVGEIDDCELHTAVLQGYDLSLLAVAKPRMRARLLEHAASPVPLQPRPV